MAPLIITDVKIFTGESVIEKGSVVVNDGIITYVGTAPPSTPDATVISKPGHTLLPGLIDAHVHVDDEQALQQSLRFGVTTVLDLHNEPPVVAKLKAATKVRNDVADFLSACLSATVDQGWPIPMVAAVSETPEILAQRTASWPRLRSESEAEAFVAKNVADGADFIKLMHESGAAMGQKFAHPSIALQTALVTASHARGLKVLAHATSLPDTLAVLEAGVDGLAHTFYDQAPTEGLIEAYRKNNAWCCPTLVAMGSLSGEGVDVQHRFAEDGRIAKVLTKAQQDHMCKCAHFKAETSKLQYSYDSVRALHEAGIDIVSGSDTAYPSLGTAFGATMHQELHLLVAYCGFSPVEALRSATAVTARRFSLDDRGIIEKGRKADLVLVEGDATADVDRTLDLRAVWRNGVLLEGLDKA